MTPVLQSVPIWDDCAFIIQSPTETILDLNDLKIPQVDLAWVAANFRIDTLLMQYSGANWHPHVYSYPPAKKRALARNKIFTKYRHVADVVHALEPAMVVPCAGPPCFLDDELFELNFSEHSIFPGADDFYRFAASEGFAERVRVLMPGDEVVPGPTRPAADTAEPDVASVRRQAALPRGVPRAPPARSPGPPRRHPRAGGAAAGTVRRLLPSPRPRQPLLGRAHRRWVLDRDDRRRRRADLRRLR